MQAEAPNMLESIVCRYEHLLEPWHLKWSDRLGGCPLDKINPAFSYRKMWEWCAIAQALYERGKLRPGQRGLGFAVGEEPLSSLFAAEGADILATDLQLERMDQEWASSGQHAHSVDALFKPDLIDRATFDRRVAFQPADMRELAGLPDRGFDFLWSSCSLEHLGSLDAGLDFIERSAAFLKPGGVAVHTTEFNVSSDDATLTDGGAVVYRRRDIEELDRRLRRNRCGLARLDFYAGDHPNDLDFDEAPYLTSGRMHLKLEMAGFVITSIMLVLQKA